jgi:hypothetical protein
MATAFVWDGTSTTWNTNHWGRAGVSPQFPGDTGSTTSDTILIATGTAPTNGPGSALTAASIIISVAEANGYANLTVTTGTFGVKGNNTITVVWAGTLVSNGLATFYGSSYHNGTSPTANVIFYDTSYNSTGTIDNAYIISTGTMSGTFNGNIYVYSHAVFSASYTVTGTVYHMVPTASIKFGGGPTIAPSGSTMLPTWSWKNIKQPFEHHW